jgi:N-acetylmuramoyl-L-alanine amidase
MATDHVVQQGEHVSQIATKYGFRDYRTIWDDAANAQLKQLRRSPNVLLPGDTLRIPDKIQKTESRATGATHRFQVGGAPLLLRLALKDWDDNPLADTKVTVTIGGTSVPLQTDGDGRVEVPISPSATEATLIFDDPMVPFDLSVPINIGHLDPVEELSGQQARLSNLGYITRPLGEVDTVPFEYVVQEFQCDFGLEVTGECGAQTQAKLKELHGS